MKMLCRELLVNRPKQERLRPLWRPHAGGFAHPTPTPNRLDFVCDQVDVTDSDRSKSQDEANQRRSRWLRRERRSLARRSY